MQLKMKKLPEQPFFFYSQLCPQTSLVHHRAQKNEPCQTRSSFCFCGERGIRSYQRTELSNSQIIKGLSYISKYCSFVEDTHTYTNDAQKYKKYMKAPNFMTDFFTFFLRHIFLSRTISCVQYSLLAQYTKRDPILCLSIRPLLS